MTMISIKSIACGSLLLAGFAFSSCEDVWEPAMENKNDINAVINNGDWMSGILSRVYSSMPYSISAANLSIDSDLATSDAYCNVSDNTYINLSKT